MRTWMRLVFSAAVALFVTSAATAQHRVGPIYPDKEPLPYVSNPPPAPPGYNPFRFNPHNQRFDYVPIPYERQPAGPNWNPYRFNWHSGRWDYRPWGPPFDYGEWARRGGQDWGTASNRVDTRVYPGGEMGLSPDPLSSGPLPVTGVPPEAQATTEPRGWDEFRIPPPMPVMILPEPTTRRSGAATPTPTTGPATTATATTGPTTLRTGGPATPPGWVPVRRLAGRWEYNYTTGKWIFVLPPG